MQTSKPFVWTSLINYTQDTLTSGVSGYTRPVHVHTRYTFLTIPCNTGGIRLHIKHPLKIYTTDQSYIVTLHNVTVPSYFYIMPHSEVERGRRVYIIYAVQWLQAIHICTIKLVWNGPDKIPNLWLSSIVDNVTPLISLVGTSITALTRLSRHYVM